MFTERCERGKNGGGRSVEEYSDAFFYCPTPVAT
jgi:hypothetical protein